MAANKTPVIKAFRRRLKMVGSPELRVLERARSYRNILTVDASAGAGGTNRPRHRAGVFDVLPC